MPCKFHTDPGGPDEFYVTPFDPPLPIECPCPGPCLGHLESIGPNLRQTHMFLECDTCGCAYLVPIKSKEYVPDGTQAPAV